DPCAARRGHRPRPLLPVAHRSLCARVVRRPAVAHHRRVLGLRHRGGDRMAPDAWIQWLMLFWVVMASGAAVYLFQDARRQRPVRSAAEKALAAVKAKLKAQDEQIAAAARQAAAAQTNADAIQVRHDALIQRLDARVSTLEAAPTQPVGGERGE